MTEAQRYEYLVQVEKDLALAQASLDGEAALTEYIGAMSPVFGPPDWTKKTIVPAFEACRQGPQRICISVPPRHGKTYTILHALAKWIRDFPQDTCAYATYNQMKGRSKSKLVRNFARHSGVELDPSMKNLGEWRTTAGGGLLAGGLSGGGLTGEGIQGILCVDDPIPTAKKAESKAYRDEIYANFKSVAMTRMEGGSIIVIQCMTGDTPVLMATGREKPLRDIKPGDAIATYDNGKVSTSTVRNWKNNGPDKVFEIRMKSGIVVRANARHPFLAEENGERIWQRTDTLKKGTAILRVTGASGTASPAPKRVAKNRPSARAGATLTTLSIVGRMAIALLLSTLRRTVKDTSDIATIATLLSGMARRRRSSLRPLSTCEITKDYVVEVVEVGTEDVFDIQVDKTENFIAGGLVSHNTRWHEDDLIGRLEKEGGWTIINIPAIAEENDPIGREAGEPLDPVRYPLRMEDSPDALGGLLEIEVSLGAYIWSALFQGQPRSKGRRIFKAPHYYDPAEFKIEGCRVVIGADPAATAKDSADHSALVVMAMRGTWKDPTFYILDVFRDQLEIPDFISVLYAKQLRYHGAHIIIEAVAGFKGVAQGLQRIEPRLRVFENQPRENKFMRAQPFAAAWNAGKVLVPLGAEWLPDFYDELHKFTGVDDAEDDQVDAGAHAFNVYDAQRPGFKGSVPSP